MKALILNSGVGRRMGVLTSEHPKCMTDISQRDTILSRQLKLLSECGVTEVIMTTGLFNDVLVDYCNSLNLPMTYTFVYNRDYAVTNYIQSIYCARDEVRDEDILLLHGDLVFEREALKRAIESKDSCVTVSSTLPLPLKDFKAVIEDDCVRKVGIEFFEHAMACQPLYKLWARDWNVWLDNIIAFCEEGVNTCYAENALNEISDRICIRPLDVKDMLCNEIDTPEDLTFMSMRVREVERLNK